MMTLEGAISLACDAHYAQTDLGGRPYILHPIRVMMAGEQSSPCQIVAILHDVFEDSSHSLAVYRRDLPPEVGAALDAITRRPDEPYDDYIGRVAESPLATRVKLEDLHDNMDLGRLGRPPQAADYMRVDRYNRASKRLQKALGIVRAI